MQELAFPLLRNVHQQLNAKSFKLDTERAIFNLADGFFFEKKHLMRFRLRFFAKPLSWST